MVAATAGHWDDRLKQMFSGSTCQDVLQKRTLSELPQIKLGRGGDSRPLQLAFAGKPLEAGPVRPAHLFQ